MAKLNNKNYTFDSPTLEDGNYKVVIKATDILGRVVKSDVYTMVINRFPPIVGGVLVSVGSQTVIPNQNGQLLTSKDGVIRYTLSTKGGVTGGSLILGQQTYDLQPIDGNRFFYADVLPQKTGVFPLEVITTDGTGEKTRQTLSQLNIVSSGKINPMAKLTVYYLETDTGHWNLWDGTYFGQENPITTDETGLFSLTLPKGKYYVDVTLDGYMKSTSQIFTLDSTQFISFDILLKPLTKINFGKISLNLPDILPPINFIVTPSNINNTQTQKAVVQNSKINIYENKNQKVDLSPYMGKPTLVSFVSTWSSTFLDQVANLESLSQSKEINVIAVFLQDSPTEVANFIKRGQYTFNYVVDEEGYSAKYQDIQYLPQSFLLNKKGLLEDIYYSFIPNSLN